MYRLYVMYGGDSYYTKIKSGDARGSVEQIGKYLAENWKYIEALGGADKVKIQKEDD